MNFVKILRPPFSSERCPNLFLNIHICIFNNSLIQEVIESYQQPNKIKFLQPSTLYDDIFNKCLLLSFAFIKHMFNAEYF